MQLNIGKKISLLRLEKGYTQEYLASLCNVSNVAVSKWENNQSYPDITTLPILARIFDISIDELLNFEKTLRDEEVMKLEKEVLNKFQTTSFEEAFAFAKSLIRLYPNNELLKIRLAHCYVSIVMLLYPKENGEALANQYQMFAKELCTMLTKSTNLLYKQTACIQLAGMLSQENEEKQAIELLESIPKLSNTVSLEASLYLQINEYAKGKNLLQKQLYSDFNSSILSIFSLLRLADKEENQEDIISYLSLMEKLCSAYQMNASMSNQAYVYYAKLEDRDKTLHYLKEYICDLTRFDQMNEDLQQKMEKTPWFSTIDISESRYPKGLMKNKILPMLNEMRFLDFLRDDIEFKALLQDL